MHRKIKGNIKQVIIKKSRSGKWFAYFCVNKEFNVSRKPIKKVVGLDLGINNFIVDTDKKFVNYPYYLNRSLNRLKIGQQKLAKKIKGSKNREKQRKRVAIIYEKTLNQRNDFLHKLSREYINNYDFIAVENLNIKNLIGLQYNARNILDASWSKFLLMLEYKAESAGVQVVRVNPRNTSKECSKCNKYVKKKLQNKAHKCPYCGFFSDRDLNASFNILKRGLSKLGQELPFEPVGDGISALLGKFY